MTVEIYLMNPASPQWQSYVARAARANGSSVGYAGIFLDNVDLSLYRAQHQETNSDGTVREYGSDTDFRQAVQSDLANLRSQVGSMPLWANMTAGSESASDWAQYLPYLDGVMDEAFVGGWDGSYPTATQWQAELQQVQNTVDSGKNVIAVAQGSQSDTDRMQFSLASYLLAADAPGQGLATFRYASSTAYDAAVWTYPPYAAQLGDPLGTRYQQPSGVWERDFACGTVTADPVAHTGTITVTNQGAACAVYAASGS